MDKEDEEGVVEDMGAHLQYQANRLGIVLWRDDCLSMANNDQVSAHDAGDRLQVVSAQPPPRKRVRLESLITKSSPEEQQRIMEKFRSLSQRNKGAVDRGLSSGSLFKFHSGCISDVLRIYVGMG